MRDVTHIVEDGQLGLSAGIGTGTHLKIGASPVQNRGRIILTGSSSVATIREKLGYSPLGDAAMDSVENGAFKVYCMPLQPEIDGSIGSRMEQLTDGSAEVTLSGRPCNAFEVVVEITGQGGLNAASFRYSINGGYIWSDDMTVPLSGNYEITEAGLTLTFEAADKVYTIGDTFRWQTTAPQLQVQQILAAVESLANIKTDVEYVHIVGPCAADVWSSIAGIQLRLQEQHHKPLMFILEAYCQEQDETLEEYRDRLLADRKKVSNYNIQVVAARMMYKGMDNHYRDVNAAGIVTGLYARVSVHKSIGETAVISIGEGRISSLLPDGMTDDIISELDAAGYLTFRQYDGLAGYYVTNANMMCPSGSDYRYADSTRVLNKIIRLSRQAALMELQSDIDMENLEAEMNKKALMVQASLEDMVRAQEISSVSVTPLEGQDILTTEELQLVIRYVERGKIRGITIYVGVSNPYAE